MENRQPKLVKGNFFEDNRGKIDFVNDFDLSPIKRMYFTSHYNVNTVRAWQGHKVEKRWFFCVKGSFTVKAIVIDDWENPSKELKIHTFILKENKPEVLLIPNGCVNGFKALEEDSKLMILSDYSFNEIEDDQVRFKPDKWSNTITWK